MKGTHPKKKAMMLMMNEMTASAVDGCGGWGGMYP